MRLLSLVLLVSTFACSEEDAAPPAESECTPITIPTESFEALAEARAEWESAREASEVVRLQVQAARENPEGEEAESALQAQWLTLAETARSKDGLVVERCTSLDEALRTNSAGFLRGASADEREVLNDAVANVRASCVYLWSETERPRSELNSDLDAALQAAVLAMTDACPVD
ncbi:MAG: hypothetical protein AB8H86_32405 [Polyangiales bacterium]